MRAAECFAVLPFDPGRRPNGPSAMLRRRVLLLLDSRRSLWLGGFGRDLRGGRWKSRHSRVPKGGDVEWGLQQNSVLGRSGNPEDDGAQRAGSELKG